MGYMDEDDKNQPCSAAESYDRRWRYHSRTTQDRRRIATEFKRRANGPASSGDGDAAVLGTFTFRRETVETQVGRRALSADPPDAERELDAKVNLRLGQVTRGGNN